jgi:hypothetical protein
MTDLNALARKARVGADLLDDTMPDYGASRNAQEVLLELAEALEELAAQEVLPWEYVPGHKWTDRNGGVHWFVGSGVISPGYVEKYIGQGGEVIRRRVGPWEEVPDE